MRKFQAPVAAAIVALIVTAGATAAAYTVTINLKGGTGSHTLKACGAVHHYTVYRVGSTIKIDGAVSPAPAAFHVKLKVKQCIRGTFKTIWTGAAQESAGGTFSGVYAARRRGAFFARAYVHVGTQIFKTNKEHFQVR